MAAKQLTTSEALKKLREQLTCPVCLDSYNHPRTLPCLHSFCHQCLSHFPVQVEGGSQCVTCPVCRQTSQQPDKGVSGYQPAFLINNLLELQQLLEKVSGSQQNGCENCDSDQATGYCKQCSKLFCQSCVDMHGKWKAFADHQVLGVEDVAATASKLIPIKEQPIMECASHGKPMEVYCDTCDQLICHLCTTARAHRNHEYEPISDAFPRHKQQIVDSLQQVKEKLATITAAVRTLETQKEGFLEQVQAVRREIEATVQQLIQLLQESKRQLLKELDQFTNTYIQKASTHNKEADIVAQLKSCEEFAEEEFRIGSQQEILVMKGQMVKHMGAVCSQVKEDNLQLLAETILRFVKSTSAVEACRSLGSVVKFSQLKAASDKTSFDLHSAISGMPLSSELLVSCQLLPANNPTLEFSCVPRHVSCGSFEVYYPLAAIGLHHLKIQVGGIDILDTPLNVQVIRRKQGRIFGPTYPCGLVITQNDQLVVAEYKEYCITIINTASKEKVKSFGKPGSGKVEFSYPVGVALSQNGDIFVADCGNHRIQVLTADGNFVAAVGSYGSGRLQFNYPYGIAVHPNKKIFVTEEGNNRVQVLNADLSFSHWLGMNGSKPREFGTPRGVCFDSNGMVYITSSASNRIHKFTPEGSLLAAIDNKGGGLHAPWGLCVDSNDMLYVTERNTNTVCMFSTNGLFLGYVGHISECGYSLPEFIVSDKFNRLYVSYRSGLVMC